MTPYKPRFLKIPYETEHPIDWLLKELQMNPHQLNVLLQFGAIYSDDQRLRNFTSIAAGQVFRIYQNPKRFALPENWLEHILYEDDDLTVVDKPHGLPSIPVSSNAVENALHLTQQYLCQKLYPLHRLDEATRGVLMFARNKTTTVRYQQDRTTEQIKKLYLCLTRSAPPLGLQTHYLKKGKGRMEIVPEGEGQVALLDVLKVIPVRGGYQSTLRLITGRTHQIRCQLSAIGSPIIGDSVYGAPDEKPHVLQLLALQIEWNNLVFTSKARELAEPV
jgi:tRNA pseudouridine32 synthase/23S rRNA pseudouridine746 synthase